MNWPETITKLLNIQYPIIQAPMLSVVTPQMVAAISELGGLGSLSIGLHPPDRTRELIRKTKSLTDKPFSVNIFVIDPPYADPEIVKNMQDYLVELGSKHGVKAEKQPIESLKFPSYEDQIDIIIEEKVPVVSFTFGLLPDGIVKRLKENNIILISAATCLKEAKILEEKGVDIIVAQGIEAGGHRSTFLEDEPLPQIGAMSLIPSIVDNVSKPVLAAGGINDGRTIKAAFALGASGVWIGTAFLASEESLAIPCYKEGLAKAQDTDFVLTKSFSGKWARGIRNALMTELENSGVPLPEFPIQVSLTGPIRMAAQQKGDKEFTSMWAGQSASKSQRKSCAEIFKDLVRQTENL